MKESNDDKQDFHEFVDWAFQSVFDALVRGGLSSVKSQLHVIIGQASRNAIKGWK